LREHLVQRRGHYRIKDEDRPSRTLPTTGKLLWRAGRAGKHVGALCIEIHRWERQEGVTRIQGVLALARKYGTNAIDDACAAELEICVPTVRFARRNVERRSAPPLSLRQVDPLIRRLTEYRDIIDKKAKETEE